MDGDGERALVDEVGIDGSRALVVPRDAGGARPLLPASSPYHRVVAAFPRDPRVLIEILATDGLAARLAVVDARGGVARWLAPGLAERFLGWNADGSAFRTASTAASGDLLLETATSGLVRREIQAAPTPYRIAACDPEGRRLVLSRALDDESDEIVVLDRTIGDGRLLLPTAGDGRFRFLAWGRERGSAFFSADDGADLPRLELVDLERGGRRPFGRLACPPLAVRPQADGSWAVVIDCGGRHELVRLDPAGDLLPAGETPQGTRALDALVTAPAGRGWLLTGGPTWPRDLAALGGDGELRPKTYGLGARLAPRSVPAARPLSVRSGAVALPARLWPAPQRTTLGVIWLSARAPRFDEFDARFAALAAAGASTLQVVGRGADGFGRTFRRAADGDPAAAALADADAALAALRRELGSAFPVTILGDGPWWGATALVLAARGTPGDVLFAALDPDPDPFAALDGAAELSEPVRQRLISRWGDPADARVAALRESWRFRAASLRAPTVIWLTPAARADPRFTAPAGAPTAPESAVEIRVASGERSERLPAREVVRWLIERALATAAAAPR